MQYPQDLIKMIKSGQNPQQLILNVLQESAQNNPMLSSLLEMAENKDSNGLETFARNYVKSQGKDFDTEFKAFRQQFGL